MWQGIQQAVKYWSFLLGKLLLALFLAGACLWAVNLFWSRNTPFFHLVPYRFGLDLLYTTVAGIVFLLGYGLVYLAILDQRYRCRVCLRRLRMPVETGSWSRMLQLGRPRIEYICTYGHGKLNVEEIRFTGAENPEWRQHSDLWDELYATSGTKSTDRPS